ncbi:MAG: recombinase [Bacteroidetes bacterium 41-46]|nr:MAG: recombinase [Bacteroidetes bacterium 41-46]
MAENTPAKKTRADLIKDAMSAPSVQEQFKNALDKNAGPFTASLIDLYMGDNKLQACDPKAVIMEALKAAVLKLPINKALGFAYIIPFNISVKNPDNTYSSVPTPTFIIGYKGLIQLAMRTDQYKHINADVVYEGELRTKNKLTGEIDLSGEATSDKIVGYFCYFELRNGFSKTLYMPVEKMAAYAKRYAPTIKYSTDVTVEKLIALGTSGVSSSSVGWTGDFTSMALKTVTRNLLSKYGYLSIEMQQAIVEDRDYDYEDESRNNRLNEAGAKKINTQNIDYTPSEVVAEQQVDDSPKPSFGNN